MANIFFAHTMESFVKDILKEDILNAATDSGVMVGHVILFMITAYQSFSVHKTIQHGTNKKLYQFVPFLIPGMSKRSVVH